jgi:ClpP class serine protease
MPDLSWLLWLFFLAQFFVPLYQKQSLGIRRVRAIRGLERIRKTRVITMIHRQETMNFLGFPIARYIDIEDSEKVLRAIRLTPPEMPVDLVLHTPGGLVLAAEQIASALRRHPGTVTVFVPHYAMSGGTLIALAADEIVMDPNAVLGPVDPQLGMGQGSVAAASILRALAQPNQNRDDQTLILGDVRESPPAGEGDRQAAAPRPSCRSGCRAPLDEAQLGRVDPRLPVAGRRAPPAGLHGA